MKKKLETKMKGAMCIGWIGCALSSIIICKALNWDYLTQLVISSIVGILGLIYYFHKAK